MKMFYFSLCMLLENVNVYREHGKSVSELETAWGAREDGGRERQTTRKKRTKRQNI